MDKKFTNPDWRMGQFLAYLRRLSGASSQTEFAERLGISRFYLSNIESGRTPLKIKAGWKVCELLQIHPDFLISCGKTNPGPFCIIDDDAQKRIDGLVNAISTTPFFEAWPAIRSAVLETGGAVEAQPVQKTELTTDVYSRTNVDVQPVLPKLIERVKKATTERGSKRKLADWLGVPRQSVTDWLSGRQEPGGETTLRLLHWVEQQERQK